MNLGLFYLERRDPAKAEGEYRAALALQPDFVPAYANLADLYRATDRESDAVAMLEIGLQQAPGNADLAHALGLAYVRQSNVAKALPLLAHAADADPGNPRYAYVYGVALHDNGQAKKGLVVLDQALQRFPGDRQLLQALAEYAREVGDSARADAYAKRLEAIAPAEAADAPAGSNGAKVQ